MTIQINSLVHLNRSQGLRRSHKEGDLSIEGNNRCSFQLRCLIHFFTQASNS
ncbi:MAG: hypothetical protein WBO76_17475 [Saprospiraceae bacterium]